jgi:hypothetical protein
MTAEFETVRAKKDPGRPTLLVLACALAAAIVALAFALAGCAAGGGSRTTASSSTSSPEASAEFVAFANALQATTYRSADVTGTAWWPVYVPAGFAVGSIETTALGDGTGPVCDVVFTKGGLHIVLTQGSPVMRDFEITPIDTAKWGTGTAAVLPADPEQGIPETIVYDDARCLAELGGDVSLSELRKMAASMKPVP